MSNLLENAAKSTPRPRAARMLRSTSSRGGPDAVVRRRRPRARRPAETCASSCSIRSSGWSSATRASEPGSASRSARGSSTLMAGEIWVEETPGRRRDVRLHPSDRCQGPARNGPPRERAVRTAASSSSTTRSTSSARWAGRSTPAGTRWRPRPTGGGRWRASPRLEPDLMVLDLNLPAMDGLDGVPPRPGAEHGPDPRAVRARGRGRQGGRARPRRRRLPDEAVRHRRAARPRPGAAPAVERADRWPGAFADGRRPHRPRAARGHPRTASAST